MDDKKNVGQICSLWRFPVKSMGGEKVQELEIASHGIVGDRAYALLDVATGKVVSAKNTKLFPEVLLCRAEFLSPPKKFNEIPAIMVFLPNGVSVRSDAPAINDELSKFFGRRVNLIQTAPPDFTIDQYHPDIEGADPGGNRNAVVTQKLGAALFQAAGLDSPVPTGSFLDVFPVSVITTSTLRKLQKLSPNSAFDEQRFRMNVVVHTAYEEFFENSWVGHGLAIHESVHLSVTMPDPRCVMTTLEQGGLPQDMDVLRTLVAHNRIQLPGMGNFPCAGVYAVVAGQGSVQVGNSVFLQL
jgi:uncharacterized protein YcbX